MLLHLLGRQVTAKTSADLWHRPLTPYSDASEDAGALGTGCEAIGIVWEPWFYFWCHVFILSQVYAFASIDLAPHGFQ